MPTIHKLAKPSTLCMFNSFLLDYDMHYSNIFFLDTLTPPPSAPLASEPVTHTHTHTQAHTQYISLLMHVCIMYSSICGSKLRQGVMREGAIMTWAPLTFILDFTYSF